VHLLIIIWLAVENGEGERKMKTRLMILVALVALLLFIASAVSISSPGPVNTLAPVEASCSGDDCGCNIELQECIADCPPEGSPDRLSCVSACRRASIQCAKACCAP
jgi:hypothetical protein